MLGFEEIAGAPITAVDLLATPELPEITADLVCGKLYAGRATTIAYAGQAKTDAIAGRLTLYAIGYCND